MTYEPSPELPEEFGAQAIVAFEREGVLREHNKATEMARIELRDCGLHVPN
jgi:hypothetical protein